MNLAALQTRASQAFTAAFGGVATLCVQAPGRVNLIGEHTDYNDGFVLPCAIDRYAVVAARARHDGVVRVVAADLGGAQDQFGAGPDIAALPTGAWANHVRGVVAALSPHLLAGAGADLALAGDVPQGAGLSSSAALEVAVGQAFKSLFGLQALTAHELARVAQQAEHRHVGCQYGVMDMLASAHGVLGHALLIDCRSQYVEPVPLPSDMAVLVVHSGVRRGLVSSAYDQRRQQCSDAAWRLGVASLRDVRDLAQLQAAAERLSPTALRRARHVVSENARTQAFVDALRSADLQRMGVLMAQSHASLRDDFEVTVPAVDRLVALLQHHIGAAGGARMTGGGFGGCVVALLPHAAVAPVLAAVDRSYRTPQGQPAQRWCCQAAGGAAALQPCAA